MCGAYYIDDNDYQEIVKIVSEFDSRVNGAKTGDIVPTLTAPVIRGGSSGNQLTALKWGYHLASGKLVINARSDTTLDPKSFNASLLKHRCAIPSSGFYEWHRISKHEKDKYQITRPDSNLLFMAGVWGTFQSPDGDYEAFVILTTDTNECMTAGGDQLSMFPDRPIHNRMPVLLEPEERDEWLDSEAFVTTVLQRPSLDVKLRRA